MSTCYRTEKPIAWDEFFANLPEGISEHHCDDPDAAGKCITDGKNYLWVHTGDGSDISFVTYGRNWGEDILNKVARQYHTLILSEHHPDFYTDEDRIEELEEVEEVE